MTCSRKLQDGRRFAAHLAHPASLAVVEAMPVTYSGGGAYEVAVRSSSLIGRYILRLTLGGEPVDSAIEVALRRPMLAIRLCRHSWLCIPDKRVSIIQLIR